MTVEITSAYISNMVVTLCVLDVSEENLQKIERTRYDEPHEMIYQFDLRESKEFSYIRNWLWRQKAVRETSPKYYHEALAAVVGTYTQAPARKYRVVEY